MKTLKKYNFSIYQVEGAKDCLLFFNFKEGRKAQENGKQSQVERIVQNLYCCCLPASINNYGTNLSLLQAIINIRLNQRDTDKGAPLCVINENGPFLRS